MATKHRTDYLQRNTSPLTLTKSIANECIRCALAWATLDDHSYTLVQWSLYATLVLIQTLHSHLDVCRRLAPARRLERSLSLATPFRSLRFRVTAFVLIASSRCSGRPDRADMLHPRPPPVASTILLAPISASHVRAADLSTTCGPRSSLAKSACGNANWLVLLSGSLHDPCGNSNSFCAGPQTCHVKEI